MFLLEVNFSFLLTIDQPWYPKCDSVVSSSLFVKVGDCHDAFFSAFRKKAILSAFKRNF